MAKNRFPPGVSRNKIKVEENNILTFLLRNELDDVKPDSALHKRLTSLFEKRVEQGWDSYINQANQEYGRDGEIEIDGNAMVSLSDSGGAYVLGWLRVDDPCCPGCEEPAGELRDKPAGTLCETCQEAKPDHAENKA